MNLGTKSWNFDFPIHIIIFISTAKTSHSIGHKYQFAVGNTNSYKWGVLVFLLYAAQMYKYKVKLKVGNNFDFTA